MKAVAVDVDGTITFRNRSLDVRAVEAIRNLKVPVIVSTGNILCYARAVTKLLGTGGIIIAENGGVIECGSVEFDHSHMEECEKAFDILGEYFSLKRLNSEFRKTEIAIERDFDVDRARCILDKFTDVEIIDTGFAVHIKSKKFNKGTGLKRTAELMGMDIKDIVAIGDSPNDIEMLKISGFGIAVANAHPDVKKVADMVTEGVHGAGVAEAVQFLKQKGELR